ncbi:AraC family transcriptional regulator [Candidatus Enterococcus clewellii]|uniref:AraC family transcriptional regulator n=2 Tax=Candidatus Enterococcus clewellii TaxID=1834193 RepID=A0AAQ3W4A2_9ENTE
MDKKAIVTDSIEYMLNHLEDNITIDDLAAHLFLSKYYFCRIFKEVTGESVYAFIRRFKMEQSAIDLKLKKERSLSEIGLDYGYSSTNYSSIFKEYYHSPPSIYRKLPHHQNTANPFYPEKSGQFVTYQAFESKIQIKEIKNSYMIFERTLGNYRDIKEKWRLFIDRNSQSMNGNNVLTERFYNDPSSTTRHNNVCDLCLVDFDYTSIHDNNRTLLEGGKFAVYPFEGYIQDIFSEIQGLFIVWLPQSPYEMSRKYGLNMYQKIDFDNNYVKMNVCIPIK